MQLYKKWLIKKGENVSLTTWHLWHWYAEKHTEWKGELNAFQIATLNKNKKKNLEIEV